MFCNQPNQNVVKLLASREVRSDVFSQKLTLQIFRQLIRSEKSDYRKTWSVNSTKAIHCEAGKLYFDNFRTCRSVYNRPLYTIPTNSLAKTVDACLCSTPSLQRLTANFESPTLSQLSYRGFLLSLTSDNWLYLNDDITGRCLQRVYLGNYKKDGYKFKHCTWNFYGDQVVLISIYNSCPAHKIREGQKCEILSALAVFSVFPLEFEAMVEIDKKIFGSQCTQVNVNESLLIIGIGNSVSGYVHIYDFQQILEKNTLFKAKLNHPCNRIRNEIVGSFPYGIPVNCKLKETPPLLFSVQCSDHIIDFGGFPFHYIIIPPRNKQLFEVRKIEDHSIVREGHRLEERSLYEPGSLYFHCDGTERIIQRSPHSVQFFKLYKMPFSSDYALEKACVMTFLTEPKKQFENITRRSISGIRLRDSIKLRVFDEYEKSVMSDDYDDELELYAILGFNPRDADCMGQVNIYDNITGNLMKNIVLDIKIEEFNDYGLNLHLNTIVIVERKCVGQYSCYVYEITWPYQKGKS